MRSPMHGDTDDTESQEKIGNLQQQITDQSTQTQQGFIQQVHDTPLQKPSSASYTKADSNVSEHANNIIGEQDQKGVDMEKKDDKNQNDSDQKEKQMAHGIEREVDDEEKDALPDLTHTTRPKKMQYEQRANWQKQKQSELAEKGSSDKTSAMCMLL